MMIDRYGDPTAVLRQAEIAEPAVAPGSVRVRVHATSLNPIDLKQIRGEFRRISRLRFPFVPGKDFAGDVESVAPDVDGWNAGDRVFGCTDGFSSGAFADFICVPAVRLARIPATLDYAEAAALPVVSLTAYRALEVHAPVRAGDRVLIQAAGGGVGTMAVQIAKARGAIVTATCSLAKASFVKSLGADTVIDYEARNYWQESERYEIVFDTLDDSHRLHNAEVVAQGGRLISINGTPSRAFAEAAGMPRPVRWILGWKNRKLEKILEGKGASFTWLLNDGTGRDLEEIARRVHSGALKPVIGARRPLAEAAPALAELSAGHAFGKIVLAVA
jgi:NADPH:quinone reductase-like Zn-dependent oxidoreductase